jgi:hypothetical protein
MHDRLEEARPFIPRGRLYELRYEDLVRDPVGQLRAVYDGLGLGDFEPVRPHVESYLTRLEGYEPNRHFLTPEEERTITDRWGAVVRRHGYEVRSQPEA